MDQTPLSGPQILRAADRGSGLARLLLSGEIDAERVEAEVALASRRTTLRQTLLSAVATSVFARPARSARTAE